jgi:general secretion pathway protein G
MIVARHAAARGTRAANRAGFTLMEVLVVVAILVILAGVGSVVVFRYLEESKENIAKLGVAKLETAVKAHKINHQDYPSDLISLTQPEGNKPAALEGKDLEDPWGQPFQYEPGNRNPMTGVPRISSMGIPGGGTPISNW